MVMCSTPLDARPTRCCNVWCNALHVPHFDFRRHLTFSIPSFLLNLTSLSYYMRIGSESSDADTLFLLFIVSGYPVKY
nr:unnamed protein product [Callosobruchus analis]